MLIEHNKGSETMIEKILRYFLVMNIPIIALDIIYLNSIKAVGFLTDAHRQLIGYSGLYLLMIFVTILSWLYLVKDGEKV